MKFTDLVPPDEQGQRILLPTQSEIITSPAKIIAAVGGYGSGKTLAACIVGNLLSYQVPGNQGIVVRRSLPKLNDSTKRVYIEVLQRLQEHTGIEVAYREMRDGLPGRIEYANGSSVIFRESTDLGRFLGPEFGWMLVDEAQEEPVKTFKDMLGRLRLPRAAKFLRFILCTNPPHKNHWLAKQFPQPGQWTTEETVSGTKVRTLWHMVRSTTRDNPFLPLDYVAELLHTHSEAEVKRILDGQYGFSHEGRSVYPQFQYHLHVTERGYFPTSIVRSWDFGFHRPAVTWHQFWYCAKKGIHWTEFREHLGEDIEAEPFATDVIAQSRQAFATIHPERFSDGGDAAGAAISDKGPGPIIRLVRPPWNLKFRYRKFADIDPGLDVVRRALRTKCPCGQYLFTVHRSCANTIEGLAGGYHYGPKEQGPGVDKPIKDGFYDNVLDTVRYAGALFFQPLLADPGFMDALNAESPPSVPDEEPWAWMERGV